MSDAVRGIEDLTLVVTAYEAAAPSQPSDMAGRRAYSLDGLRALARAVRDLEETG
jgi:hypothetical protein